MREQPTQGRIRGNQSLERKDSELRKFRPKRAARQDPNPIDHFTSTIIPCRTLRSVAVPTIKHVLLLVGFAAALVALIRQLLAD